MAKKNTAVFVTNIPVPYRERVHEIVAKEADIEYTVLYCAKIEPNRLWKIEPGSYRKNFLNEASLLYRGNKIYFGLNVLRELKKIKPNVVILGGLSITMLYAYAWALLSGAKCIIFSDSHLEHERQLTPIHKLVRTIFYKNAHAFIGPSEKTKQLFSYYTNSDITFFQSHLCIDNMRFFQFAKPFDQREYDIIYSGQINEIKMPFFFVDVVCLMQKTRNVKVLIIGDGPDKEEFIHRLTKTGAQIKYAGFLNQAELPCNYSNAKILLFPTKGDAWGIVANEALAAGTPVITCGAAGVADVLVTSNKNGYVLPLDPEVWADQALKILNDIDLWNRLSDASISSVREFSYENAAKGIVDAIRYVRF